MNPAAAAGAEQDRLASGLVVRSYSNVCTVRLAGGKGDPDGEAVVEASLRGHFRQDDVRPLTGDRVEVRLAADGSAVIEAVMPRTTVLERPPVANVEQALVMLTPAQPPVPLDLVDRILVHVERDRIDAALVWNKSDLSVYQEEAERIRSEQAIYEQAGYPVFTCSARQGRGIEPIARWLSGRITVVAGPSGVGKSSLMNALNPDWERPTGAVGSRRRRGRHVTRGVSLLQLSDGGWVADSPGFSRLNLDGIFPEELSACFRELRPHLQACRFSECLHHQEPGCGVKKALEGGEISAERYGRYLEFLEECRRWEAERYD